MKRNNIAYLRSTEIYNDSRATKEIESYSLCNNVLVFGWNRNLTSIDLSNSETKKYSFYNKKAKYGSGIKNIFRLLGFNLWLIKQLKKNINEIDVIHCCDLDTAIAGYYISKKYNKKLIYDIYDYYVDCHNLGFLKDIAEKIDIKIMNYADVVLLCTEKRREQISKANPKYIEIIHNSPRVVPTNDSKKNNNKINIGYFGILQDDRLLLEISNEIIKHKDLVFHIGGFGKYESYFKELSQKYDNVIFYGTLKYSEVIEKEKMCDVLFATYNPEISNHKYSAPNKVYESMALNLPIIVCKNTGIDEVVANEKIGFVINYNAEEFINVVKTLKQNDFNNCSSVFEKKYSWNVMEEKLLQIIKNLTNN